MPDIPVTFRVGTFPETWRGDINRFAQDLANRLTLESSTEIAFIATGSVLPTSDVGPFWKEDTREWYGWDDDSGQYVVQSIDESTRGFTAQALPGPDQTRYVFFIEVDGTGKAKSIRYYSGGAWKDVYEDKFAQYPTFGQMNSAISAAVGGGGGVVGNRNIAVTSAPGNQDITSDDTFYKVTLDGEEIDTDSNFDTGTSEYTAPETGIYQVSAWAQIDNNGAVAAQMEITIAAFINNVESPRCGATSVATPPGQRWYPTISARTLSLSSGDKVDLRIKANDGSGANGVTVSQARFEVRRIA